MRSMDPEYFKQLEQFIDNYIDANNRSPSTREIAVGTGRGLGTVHKYLTKMRENGILDYSGHRNITTRRRRKMIEESVQVPVLGKVSCGNLKFAEECIEEYVHLPVALFGWGKYFMLRANGESMIDAGIDDGTLVLVRQQDYASPGQIVVALVGEEATLKRYYPEPELNHIRLYPENRNLVDIVVPDCQIQGVAIMVLKDLL